MPTKDINTAAKPLRDNWQKIQDEYAAARPGKKLVLTCVHRTVEEQQALYAKGRIKGSDGKWVTQDKSKVVTNVDGISTYGAHNHNPARAIDVMVVDKVTGHETWEERYYLDIGPIVRKLGLTWGGDWKSIKDLPHIEVQNYKTYQGD
jgi:peptidoglycan L-alanyl-D-glutamate endopeptidase CwlK